MKSKYMPVAGPWTGFFLSRLRSLKRRRQFVTPGTLDTSHKCVTENNTKNKKKTLYNMPPTIHWISLVTSKMIGEETESKQTNNSAEKETKSICAKSKPKPKQTKQKTNSVSRYRQSRAPINLSGGSFYSHIELAAVFCCCCHHHCCNSFAVVVFWFCFFTRATTSMFHIWLGASIYRCVKCVRHRLFLSALGPRSFRSFLRNGALANSSKMYVHATDVWTVYNHWHFVWLL